MGTATLTAASTAEASIDWRDFVVVQHITFRDDEDVFLPAPRDTVEDMAAMLQAKA